jgi:biotin-(acetyl-CoA carboxylase) ligase
MLAELGRHHVRWSEKGFAAIYPELTDIDHLSGQMVSVLQTDSDPMPVTGLCGGIQPDGTLLVGATRIYAGEAHVC